MTIGMGSKWKALSEKYEIGRLLGQGTYGKVYYARNLRTSQSVAVKVIDKEKIFRSGLINQIKREILVMRMVRHPNIVQLFEVMATKTKIFFILEYAKGGEFFNKLAKGRLREDVAQKYFKQLINAVDFCHGRGVYHRDIKPENLLLDENDNLKISDFGLSALAESKRQDGLLHTECGTPAYVPPELLCRKGYDGAKADIWCCGVVLFVLLSGYLPFHDPNLMEMYRKIEKAEYKCPYWFSTEARKLLKRMLDPHPETRIPMAKIKESSWFRKALILKDEEAPTDSPGNTFMDASTSSPSENCSMATGAQESAQPPSLNAFDIISLSAGFDLSGLFEDKSQLRGARFTSREPAPVIISKLEEMAKQLKLKVKKKNEGLLNFEGIQEGRKGIMSIDAEIFEVTQSFHLIELNKSYGDTMEYQKMLEDEIRPALRDIIWVWQSKPQEQQQQLHLQEQPQLQIQL